MCLGLRQGKAETNIESPLAPGIRDVQNRMLTARQLAEKLRDGHKDSFLAISRILYEGGGGALDPGRQILEIEGLLRTTIEGIEQGQRGLILEPFGKALQLSVDLVISKMPESPLRSKLLVANLSQQVGHEILRAAQSEQEARMFDRLADTYSKIGQILTASESSWQKRQALSHTKKPIIQRKTTATLANAVPNGQGDSLIDLLQWVNQGNRTFSNPTQENRFYTRNPELRQFRSIGEIRSPESEFEQWNQMIQKAQMEDGKRRLSDGLLQQLKAKRRKLNERAEQLIKDAKDNQTAWGSCFGACVNTSNSCLGACNNRHDPVGTSLNREVGQINEEVGRLNLEILILELGG